MLAGTMARITHLVESLLASECGTGGTSSSTCARVSADLADDGDTVLDLRLRPKKDILCFTLVWLSASRVGGMGGARCVSGCFASGRLPRNKSEMSEVFERRRLVDCLCPGMASRASLGGASA